MMIAPRKLLKSIKASLQNRVVTLAYPWNPQPRFNQQQILTSKIHSLCEQNILFANTLIQEFSVNKSIFSTFPFTLSGDKLVYWQNDFLAGLDIISLYTILQRNNPGKIIEIGSGHSTAVMRTAIINTNLQSKLICIDPSPRREVKDLADEWISKPLEELEDLSLFKNLSPGDIVFFDGSHISLTNSDVTVFFLEILPLIPSGVYVQIHDIYLPFDYPVDFATRGYNEQYLLALALTYGSDKFELVFPAWFTYQRSEAQLNLNRFIWNDIDPKGKIEKHGGSFWFKIK